MFEKAGWQVQARAQARAGSRRWLWGLLGIWLLACIWLLARHADGIAAMRLPDADDSMRLLQVRAWLDGQGWFDLRQYRLDPPLGADMHWSRLVDLPLAAAILALRPFFGEALAEQAAVALIPLCTLLVAMGLAAAIVRRAVAPAAWPWACAALLMATPALGMMEPLRIDHHGWQIAALYATLLGLIHEDRRWGGALAGLSLAASLAIGVEMLPYLALCGLLAATGWLADAREGERLRWFGASAALGTLAALFLFIPPAMRFGGACDALSDAYAVPLAIGALGIAALSFQPLETRARRAAGLAAVGLLAALPLLGATGRCLADPYQAVDPLARRLWLENVAEALPLWRQSTETFLASLVLPLIGLAGAAAMCVRCRHRKSRRRIWTLLLTVGLVSILLAFAQTRAAVAAQALAVPGAAALGFLGRRRLARSGSMPVRVFGSVALFLAVTGLAPRLAVAALAGEKEMPADTARDAATAACLTPEALAPLDRLPPGTFLGMIDTTPALLLHGRHTGIAGPYHRNGRAIADVMTAWVADDAAAQALARRHHATYIFLCGETAEALRYRQRAPGGLYARLAGGARPSWLEPVPLGSTPWKAWRIRG